MIPVTEKHDKFNEILTLLQTLAMILYQRMPRKLIPTNNNNNHNHFHNYTLKYLPKSRLFMSKPNETNGKKGRTFGKHIERNTYIPLANYCVYIYVYILGICFFNM